MSGSNGRVLHLGTGGLLDAAKSRVDSAKQKVGDELQAARQSLQEQVARYGSTGQQVHQTISATIATPGQKVDDLVKRAEAEAARLRQQGEAYVDQKIDQAKQEAIDRAKSVLNQGAEQVDSALDKAVNRLPGQDVPKLEFKPWYKKPVVWAVGGVLVLLVGLAVWRGMRR